GCQRNLLNQRGRSRGASSVLHDDRTRFALLSPGFETVASATSSTSGGEVAERPPSCTTIERGSRSCHRVSRRLPAQPPQPAGAKSRSVLRPARRSNEVRAPVTGFRDGC